MPVIDLELYNRFNDLGLIPNNVRKDNVGKSDYARHTIQPWSIWKDYNLNPWDADIVKRILRTKEEAGMSETEARIMDYKKIKHICDERIRQLEFTPTPLYEGVDITTEIFDNYIVAPKYKLNKSVEYNTPILTYTLNQRQVDKYNQFKDEHRHCNGYIKTCFSHESGIGVSVKFLCTGCGSELDATELCEW
jgi:hypothetical protein